jgi:outer membrane protein assembly factor BamD (BamD/ComL family)
MPRLRAIHLPLFLILACALFLAGCGRVHYDEHMSQEELWQLAQEQFRYENYLNAIDILSSFTLNYSGSTMIDSAQYLLAESHFALGEYILAESEYNRLLQNMKQSSLAPQAELKIVLCNAYSSPPSGLDQNFTEKAVATAQNYLEDYPSADFDLRLAPRANPWETLGSICSFGLWRPRPTKVTDSQIFDTKVVYPHYAADFGSWLMKVITFGIYRPPAPLLVIAPSTEVKGDWVANHALQDLRARLARKDFKSGELYYRQQKFPSAVIYFDRVLDIYGDTPWAKPALKSKGDALFAMHKYPEASGVYTKYLSAYGDDYLGQTGKRLRLSQQHPALPTKSDSSVATPDSSGAAANP